MGSFNLNDLLNQRSKEISAAESERIRGDRGIPSEEYPSGEDYSKEKIIMVDVRELIPSDKNFYQVDTNLKESIELFGLLQPILAQKKDDGYHIIAGHRRRLAVLELIDEGKEEFAMVPVVLYKSETDELDRLALIVANRFREKTEWEKMKETIETDILVKALKTQMSLPGKTREMVSQILDVSESTIAKYKAIAYKLSEDLMEAFHDGKITMRVGYEASSLDAIQQEELYSILASTGNITEQIVRSFKTSKQSAKSDVSSPDDSKSEISVPEISEPAVSDFDVPVKEAYPSESYLSEGSASDGSVSNASVVELDKSDDLNECASGYNSGESVGLEEYGDSDVDSAGTYTVIIQIEVSVASADSQTAQEQARRALIDAGYKVISSQVKA